MRIYLEKPSIGYGLESIQINRPIALIIGGEVVEKDLELASNIPVLIKRGEEHESRGDLIKE